jgi:hypothetical protein
LRFLTDHLHEINEKSINYQENDEEKYRQQLYLLARNKNFQATQRMLNTSTINLPLRTIQYALIAAAKANDVPSIAEFMLTHARAVSSLAGESPLQMFRNEKNVERAWQFADLYNMQACAMWYLLLAWELKSVGKPADSKRTLRRLIDKERLERTEDPSIIISLLVQILELDKENFMRLSEALLSIEDRYELCDALANAGYFQTAIDASHNLGIHQRSNLCNKIALLTLNEKDDVVTPIFHELGNVKNKREEQVALKNIRRITKARDLVKAGQITSAVELLNDTPKVVNDIAPALAVADLKLEDRTAMFNELIRNT